MPPAKQFTFGSYALDKNNSTLTFEYEVELEDGSSRSFKDVLTVTGASAQMWDSVPKDVLEPLCESLSLILGVNYWKIHCAPSLRIKDFEIDKTQADFWNAVYEKGLAEFFYLSKRDFRGLISFPYSEKPKEPGKKTPFPRRRRALLAQGGGKDSAVSAEMLREQGMPFDLFVVGYTSMQELSMRVIGRPFIYVKLQRHPIIYQTRYSRQVPVGYPLLMMYMFTSVLLAALFDYRYIVFSNESSADIPHTTYLGLDVNHQWSKSKEAEYLTRAYIISNISQDIIPFSLLRQFSEIEMVRRFVAYPQYFFAFSSCNLNFFTSRSKATAREGRAYWCNSCPKCIFIFACLSAFIPKKTLLDMFGENLYAKPELLPWFKQLLGLEGFKPLECVGSAEEMIVAMHRASLEGEYNDTVAMELFSAHFSHLDTETLDSMEKNVFGAHGESLVPPEFMRKGMLSRSITFLRNRLTPRSVA